MNIIEEAKQKQNVADQLVQKAIKKELSKTAKEKIKMIYTSSLNSICTSDMENLNEIGIVIDEIDDEIKTTNKYYDDFIRLKNSFNLKMVI